MAKNPVVERALECFKQAEEAEHDQRTRELEDLKFVRGRREDQWHDADLTNRKGNKQTGVSPRPTLVINQLRQPIAQIVNQAKAARLSVHFAADSEDADEATAEVFEDLAREIQNHSRAHIARDRKSVV